MRLLLLIECRYRWGLSVILGFVPVSDHESLHANDNRLGGSAMRMLSRETRQIYNDRILWFDYHVTTYRESYLHSRIASGPRKFVSNSGSKHPPPFPPPHIPNVEMTVV
jgi:hypothetical protein